MKDLIDTFPDLRKTDKNQIEKLFPSYLFYHRINRKTKEFYCTHCQKTFRVAEIQRTKTYWEQEAYNRKHNDICKCPYCKEQVTLKCEGRGYKTLRDVASVTVMIARNKRLYARCFLVAKQYCNGIDTEVYYSENYRYCFEKGKGHKWTESYNYSSKGYVPSWHENKKVTAPYDQNYFGINIAYRSSNFIVINPDAYKKVDCLKYCCFDLFNKAIQNKRYSYYREGMDKIFEFLALYVKYPYIELMLKGGLEKIVVDKISNCKGRLNWRGKTITSVLGMTKQEIKQFKSHSPGLTEISEYKFLKKYIPKLTVDKFYNKYSLLYYDEKLIRNSKSKYEIEPFDMLNYISKNKANIGCGAYVYKDYLEQCLQLGYDLTQSVIAFPKDLNKAHNDAIALIKYKAIAEKEKLMDKRTKKLQKMYTFEYESLEIKIPESLQEIIDEGQTLQHCVGGYTSGHAEGKTTILFIRHKDDENKPFFTLEIDDKSKRIKQYHGFKNEYLDGEHQNKPQEIEDFVKAFKEFLASKKKRKSKTKNKEVAA